MSKPVQKYIDVQLIKKIKEIQNMEKEKNKKCSFVRASKLLVKRL